MKFDLFPVEIKQLKHKHCSSVSFREGGGEGFLRDTGLSVLNFRER